MSSDPKSQPPADAPAAVRGSIVAPTATEQPLAGSLSNASIWIQEDTLRTFDWPQVAADTNVGSFDVVVVGGGIVGVTSAWLLKKAGKKVALIEARRIGCGTTGFSTAKLTSQQQLIYQNIAKKYDLETARKYAEMQEAAITQAEEIINELGLECNFRRTPHATWASEEKKVPEIVSEYETAIKIGLPAELVDPKDIEVPASVEAKKAVRFRNQGEFNAYKFCVQLAKHINGDGCMVFENSPVNEVSDMGAPHKIKCTNGGHMEGAHVILATHLPIMDRSHHFAIVPPSKSHVIAVKLGKGDGTLNKVGAGQLRGMYINADSEKRSIRTTQDGTVLIVSGESFETGDETDVEKRYKALEEWAHKHFVVESNITRWSSMDYFSSTILPYIGLLYRGTTSIYTATGFSKWGLTNGIASGLIFRDAIMGVANPWAEMVDARRWDRHMLPSAVMEGWHTVKHMVGDKVKARFAPDISTLKPGDGGIVKAGGEIVGAYLDKNGKYHLVNPVCTHLGCNVLFNHTDRTWDCGCHGSQFAVDGTVIHGPACTNLCKRDDLKW